MLIWCRAKKDELIYTLVLAIITAGLSIMFFGDYLVGLFICLIAMVVFAFSIIWNG